ncbi:hypothetical protein FPQ18DRAFT_325488 [Pyronema domesticum]|nr:hypothetical protein FPQ18DRAFT_325488 [Pyronema domesticum]
MFHPRLSIRILILVLLYPQSPSPSPVPFHPPQNNIGGPLPYPVIFVTSSSPPITIQSPSYHPVLFSIGGPDRPLPNHPIIINPYHSLSLP